MSLAVMWTRFFSFVFLSNEKNELAEGNAKQGQECLRLKIDKQDKTTNPFPIHKPKHQKRKPQNQSKQINIIKKPSSSIPFHQLPIQKKNGESRLINDHQKLPLFFTELRSGVGMSTYEGEGASHEPSSYVDKLFADFPATGKVSRRRQCKAKVTIK